ncbi:hypothetical protein [Oceanithermus sp.]|uniref:hypothetical protein n=1 Tax=Oceanithermus sp. TaxID=2268145 RepID=UPI00257D1659|nr:hypothetical protein [Oceanithermus sp.]
MAKPPEFGGLSAPPLLKGKNMGPDEMGVDYETMPEAFKEPVIRVAVTPMK